MPAFVLLLALARAETPHEALCAQLRSKRPSAAAITALGPAAAGAEVCVFEEAVWHRDAPSAPWVLFGIMTGGIGFLFPDITASGSTSMETHEALPMELALARRDAALVRAVLATGADPNAGLTFGDPPLERAIDGDDPAVVEALLAAGADMATLDEAMFDSALVALYNGPLLPILKAHGLGPDLRDVMGRPVLLDAVEAGDAGLVTRLLADGADAASVDGFGHSGVELAVAGGRLDLARTLMDAGASPDVGEPPPLVVAVRRGDLAAADLLVSRGASLRPEQAWDRTLLQIAAYSGSVPAVEWALAHGFGVDEVADGSTALTDAAEAGHVDVLRALLAAGADPRRAEGRGDPVARAASWGHLPAVEVLLAAHPEVEGDRRPREEAHTRAVFAALRSGKQGVLTALVGKGAVPGADERGVSPMQAAVDAGQWEVVAWLQARGVAIDEPIAHGRTLLALALLDGDTWDAADLVAHGASVARAGGASLYVDLAAADRVRSMAWLRERGISPDPDTARRAVAAAIRAEADDALADLLDHGAPVTGALPDGATLAHVALPHPDVLPRLAAAGAPLDLPDAAGRTPLSLALEMPNLDVALFLLAHGADPRRAAVDPLQVAVDRASNGLFDAMFAAGARATSPVEVRLDRAYWMVPPLRKAGVPYHLAFTIDEAIAAGNVGAAELAAEDGLGIIGLPQLRVAVENARLDAVRHLAGRVGPLRARDGRHLLRLARERGIRWEVRQALDEAERP